ncbi:MAG: hypothetical protein ACEY3B_00595 [Wolbachia sp.]
MTKKDATGMKGEEGYLDGRKSYLNDGVGKLRTIITICLFST